MDDDVRVEPGIAVWRIFIVVLTLCFGIPYGSLFLVAIGLGVLFSGVVVEGFWPYLSEEQEREIRRKRAMREDDTDWDS